jgi:hypothetical protein
MTSSSRRRELDHLAAAFGVAVGSGDVTAEHLARGERVAGHSAARGHEVCVYGDAGD